LPHDSGEERENDTRRDDGLERDFGVVGRDFMRGSDRNDILFSEYLADRAENRKRDNELFDARMAARSRQESAHEDRDGLRFRDAAIHSTAVGSLEGEVAAVGDALQEAVEDDEAE